MRPQAETDFVVAYLFGDEDGRRAAEEMQCTKAELPGLDGTGFLLDATRTAIRRSAADADRPSQLQRATAI